MPQEKVFKDEVLNTAFVCAADFRRIFGVSIADFYSIGPGGVTLDFSALFKALGIPLDETSREYTEKKYGPEAVMLLGRVIM